MCDHMRPSMPPALCRIQRRVVLICLALAAAALPAQPPATDAPRVGLFDSVAQVLTRRWPDRVQRDFVVEPLIREHRAAARAARTFGDEVSVVRSLLTKIPSSHLGLTSVTSYRGLSRALRSEREPMFGMQLVQWDGRWFATAVLDGGPAHRAGVRAWDEILAIDGAPPGASPRLDYSSDDAFLSDDRDPPVHPLIASALSVVSFHVRQSVDLSTELDIGAEPYSMTEGTEASLRVIETEGIRVGYVHLFFMHLDGGANWLAARFNNEWANVDAVVLDLRGRGGDGSLAYGIADVLGPGLSRRFAGPVVALQDRQTRSAKEMLLHLLRTRKLGILVGEPSAGAVVSSGAIALGNDMMLMMPVRPNEGPWARLELHPVEPDVAITWGGPLSGDADPILAGGLREAVRLVVTTGRGVVVPELIPPTKHKATARP